MSSHQKIQFPIIEPLETAALPPFWSVMIPAYNRTTYLERTLRSVLEQAPDADEMQIEVIDNASTSPEVKALVRRIGGDRVTFFQQPSNIGIVGNWNTCLQRARGRWVHILHDDDIVRPGFYDTYRQFIETHSDVGMVVCRPIAIDEDDEWKRIMPPPPGRTQTGMWDDALWRLVSENTSDFLRFPAIVVAREAYEKVGGFDPASIYTIDLQMWIRVAASFPTGYIHQPLALYREHNDSVTYKLVQNRDVLPDIDRTLSIGISTLPAGRRDEARCAVDRTCAQLAEMYCYYFHQTGHHGVALRYSRHVYRHIRSPRNLMLVLKSWVKVLHSQILKRVKQ